MNTKQNKTEKKEKKDWRETAANAPFEPTLEIEKQVKKILSNDFYTPEDKAAMMYLIYPNGKQIADTGDDKFYNKLPIIEYDGRKIVMFCICELLWRLNIRMYKIKEIAVLTLKTMAKIRKSKDDKKDKELWDKLLEYSMKTYELDRPSVALIVKTINRQANELKLI